jgi:response regulator RpfG family c-di-GMP phosphodiesterase
MIETQFNRIFAYRNCWLKLIQISIDGKSKRGKVKAIVSATETVLVVDDEPAILEGIKRYTDDSYQIYTALNAADGLVAVSKHKDLALVISDYKMPGMNGLEFLAKVQQMAPRAVRILITGFGDLQLAKEAVNRCHIFKMLTKPCPIGELVKAINEAIIEHHLLDNKINGNGNGNGISSISSLLAVLAERDNITEGHSERIVELCYLMGQKMGLTSEQLIELEWLSQLHDIGKIGIPDRILFKQGSLTAEEWAIMRKHSEIGYRIALSNPELVNVANMILKHHERWDGTGYPLGLKGEQIPIEVRILAVADAFDVMTHDRPYKKATTFAAALGELQANAGSQFDPHLVKVMFEVLKESRGSLLL